MKRRFNDYTRLARGIFGVSSLWLGPRDILYVRGTGVLLAFTEEYIRFELDGIRSVAVVKTYTGRVLNAVYGLLAAVLGIIGGIGLWHLIQEGTDGVAEFALVVLVAPSLFVAAIATILLLINLALGPTCHFQIQSATRIERVRPVRRLRTARRVLAHLGSAVGSAQAATGSINVTAADPISTAG